jgi:hypothetical protein
MRRARLGRGARPRGAGRAHGGARPARGLPGHGGRRPRSLRARPLGAALRLDRAVHLDAPAPERGRLRPRSARRSGRGGGTADRRGPRGPRLPAGLQRGAARQRYRRRARRIEAHPRLTSFSRRFTAHGRRARRSKDALELALAKALSHLWDLVEREQARAWWEDYEGGFDRAMMETLEGSIPQRADETEATYALRLRAVERAYRARLSNYTRAPARSGTPLREAA